MSWYRFRRALDLVPVLVLAATSACGDGGGDDGTGGSSTGGSSTGGVGATTGGGTGGATGGSPPTGGTGATSGGGTGGGGSEDLSELLDKALDDCSLLDMGVTIQFDDDMFATTLGGRVTDGSTMAVGSEEVVEQESISGHMVELRWAVGAADGAQVPVSGWVHQDSDSVGERYRCFDGEVRVRVDSGGALHYLFAASTVYEATADGTCGASTADDVVFGCLPDDY